jgi:hypothetical protein
VTKVQSSIFNFLGVAGVSGASVFRLTCVRAMLGRLIFTRKKKKIAFSLFFSHFFVTLALNSKNKLKNEKTIPCCAGPDGGCALRAVG